VRRITFPNNLGVDYFTITWTMARRTNGQLIESIGVQPDVKYSLTDEDLQFAYRGYRQALLTTINAQYQ
jgi:C-terminal processing protease CtpA/Prc